LRKDACSCGKPFWLEHPWNLLIDPSRVEEDPWNVDIADLIMGFLEKMRELELINYWISGKALLSASIIHRIKSELLLKFSYGEEENSCGSDVVKVDIPPIPMPFRITSRKVTLSELLVALQQALIAEAKRRTQVSIRKAPSEDQEDHNPEEIILESLHEEYDVELKLESLYQRIVSSSKNIITLSSLANGDPESVIDVFLALLYLSFRGLVYIWQEKPGGEIYIMEGEKWRKMLKL